MVNLMGLYARALMVAMMTMYYQVNYCYTNYCDYVHSSCANPNGVCKQNEKSNFLISNFKFQIHILLDNQSVFRFNRFSLTQVNMMDLIRIEFVANELCQDVESPIIQCHRLCKMECHIECAIRETDRRSRVMVRLVFDASFA